MPLAQLVVFDVIQVINGALTILQSQHLRPEIKLVIAGKVVATRQLIQVYGLTFAHIQALSAKELYELIN